MLGDTEFIVLESQDGGYGGGTPRAGWDHAGNWIVHGVKLTGLAPRVIKAELTIAPVNPAMADLIPLHEKSYADALAEIDTLWAATEATA